MYLKAYGCIPMHPIIMYLEVAIKGKFFSKLYNF